MNLDEQPEAHKPEQEAQEAQLQPEGRPGAPEPKPEQAAQEAQANPKPRAQGASLQVEQGQRAEGGEVAALPTGEATSEPVADQFTRGERLREEKRQSRRFARQAAEADPVGSAASGPDAGGDPEGGADSETDGPDWEDATSVLRWYGSEIIRLIHLARRKEALSRLRALASSLDCWSKLARLSADTAEIQQIKVELSELRQELEQQKTAGRLAVLRAGL